MKINQTFKNLLNKIFTQHPLTLLSSDTFFTFSSRQETLSFPILISVFLLLLSIAAIFSVYFLSAAQIQQKLFLFGVNFKIESINSFLVFNHYHWHYLIKQSQLLSPLDLFIFMGFLYLSFLATYLSSIQLRIPIMIISYVSIFLFFYGYVFFLFFLYLILSYYLLVHFESKDYAPSLFAHFIIALFLATNIPSSIASLIAFEFFILTFSSIFKYTSIKPRIIIRNFPLFIVFFILFKLRGVLFQTPINNVIVVKYAAAILLFLQFTIRLLFHSMDLRDSHLPYELRFKDFVVIFFLIPDFILVDWWFHPGQGLHYLKSSFNNKEKNEIISDGIYSILLGSAYFIIITPALRYLWIIFSNKLGYEYIAISDLYRAYLKNIHIDKINFLLSMIWEMFYGSFCIIGGLHLKVGIYRIFGFNVRSYTDFPWLSTSLPEFWKRYGYHFMQQIMKGFYLPAFLKLRNFPIKIRMYISIFYAAFVGHLLGYAGVALYDVNLYHFLLYPLFLSIGISYSFSNKSFTPPFRKPWTFDKYLPIDLFKCCIINLFYAFVSLFMYYEDINTQGKFVFNLIKYVFFSKS